MSFYKQRFLFSFALVSFACIYNGLVSGHGMLLDPPGRSSRWRYNSTAPTNYDDNGLNCGGMSVQWEQNNGKCGLCGDNYATPIPRANEIGGYYGGTGVITKEFRDSYTASVGVRITSNHLGYFHFDLCNLSEFGDESENCFAKYSLRFVDGSDRLYIGSTGGLIVADLVWPEQLNCEHCVLRWTYTGGNNWGPCGNGTDAMGCGPQETFVNCADISIAFPTTDSPNVYRTADISIAFPTTDSPNVYRTDVHSVEGNVNDEVPDYGYINEIQD